MFPEGIYYTKEHEWVSVTGETATIGITHHAQGELGDVVFVELPEIGAVLTSGAQFGTVESTKAVSEIYSPVTGQVVEINSTLRDAPEAINRDPYGEGWIVRVRLSDPKELLALLDAGGYRAYVESGAH